MTETEVNKALVVRLVEDVINAGRIEVLDDLYAPSLAAAARRWITPFRESFPDVRMRIVELIAEGEKVVGRFTCSGTHRGAWLGYAGTGRRFERIDEVYIFRIRNGRIVHAWVWRTRSDGYISSAYPRSPPVDAERSITGGRSRASAENGDLLSADI